MINFINHNKDAITSNIIIGAINIAQGDKYCFCDNRKIQSILILQILLW